MPATRPPPILDRRGLGERICRNLPWRFLADLRHAERHGRKQPNRAQRMPIAAGSGQVAWRLDPDAPPPSRRRLHPVYPARWPAMPHCDSRVGSVQHRLLERHSRRPKLHRAPSCQRKGHEVVRTSTEMALPQSRRLTHHPRETNNAPTPKFRTHSRPTLRLAVTETTWRVPCRRSLEFAQRRPSFARYLRSDRGA